MDQKEFDALVRRLAQEATRRRVVGTGLGAAGAAFVAAAADIAGKAKGKDGKKKDRDGAKKKGKGGKGDTAPAAPAAPEPDDAGPEDQGCIATGKKCRKKKNGKVRNRCAKCCSQLSDGTTCICAAEGGACTADANCCAGSCVDGVCGGGPPPACLELGSACKGVGRACCQGLACASGQGGESDVACYVPKTGRCASTAECVFGMVCANGVCSPPPPAELAEPCSLVSQQLCVTPAAVCTVYDGAGAPAGAFCTLPLGETCTGNADCTCYTCGEPNTSAASGAKKTKKREGRDIERLVCCGDVGYPCTADRNCCGNTVCANGRCAFLS